MAAHHFSEIQHFRKHGHVSDSGQQTYYCELCLLYNEKKAKPTLIWNTKQNVGYCHRCKSTIWAKRDIEQICAQYMDNHNPDKCIENYQTWSIKNWTHPIEKDSEPYQYLVNRGINQDLIIKYNIRYCSIPYSGIVLPNGITDEVNFFQIRDLNPKAQLRYLNPSSLKPVYGEFIPKHSNIAVICEGVISCISTDSDQYNSYALYGKSPSDAQMLALKRLDYDEYVVCLDGGEITAILKLAQKLINLEKKVSIILLPIKKDPNDVKQFFNKFFINRVNLTELSIKILLAKFKSIKNEANEKEWNEFYKACTNFNKNSIK